MGYGKGSFGSTQWTENWPVFPVQTGDREISIAFGQEIDVTAYLAILSDPSTYALVPVDAGVYPGGSFNPTSVTVVSPSVVRLTVPYLRDAADYLLSIAGVLVSIYGKALLAASKSWAADVSAPRATRVEALGFREILVSFSRELADDAAFRDPSSYSIVGSTVESVEVVSSRAVKLTLGRAVTRAKRWQLTFRET